MKANAYSKAYCSIRLHTVFSYFLAESSLQSFASTVLYVMDTRLDIHHNNSTITAGNMFSPVATASLLRKHWLTDRQKTVPQLPPPLNSPGPAKNDLGSQSSNNETAGVLRPNGRNYCQIFGSTPSGRISALAFSSTATVAALKTMVQKRDGVPRDEQILVFEGKMLDSGFILAAYGVQRNATIHVTLRLRGGSEQFNRHPSEGGAAARPVNISTALDSAESVTEVDELEDIYAG